MPVGWDAGGQITRRGALVISLDFELQWGLQGHYDEHSSYRQNILGARCVIPRLLDLFEEFNVAATWATVGFLFAESRDELFHYAPSLRPAYRKTSLNPYPVFIGRSETEDPLHFAPSLIAEVRNRRQQEIGSHTFSHYYCLEPGADRLSFEADLQSAISIAGERGIALTSLVFPRNQGNPEAILALSRFGFTAYRGREQGWMHDPQPRLCKQSWRRMARLLHQHVVPATSSLVPWSILAESGPVTNVQGSLFFRPFTPANRYLDELRLKRLINRMWQAARMGQILHIWWHPHNFGRHPELNLSALRRLLTAFADYRERFVFESLSMAQAARRARAIDGATHLELPVDQSPADSPVAFSRIKR